MEEPDQKMPPHEDIPTVLITHSPNLPPNSKAVWLWRSVISYPSSVGSVLLWVPTITPKEAHHSSGPHISAMEARGSATTSWYFIPGQHDEGEASLEDIPTNIYPITAISGSNSTSTLMDLAELWTNANKALDDLLSIKGSIDARRWRAVWDLGMMLCQNESQAAAKVKEARIIHSQMALDIQTACSKLILEARTSYLVVVKEAKTTRSHLLQEAMATCSKFICEAKARKISQAQCSIRSMENTYET